VVSEGEDGSTKVIVPPTTVPEDEDHGDSGHDRSGHHGDSTPSSADEN
jgi:hypothetical protein